MKTPKGLRKDIWASTTDKSLHTIKYAHWVALGEQVFFYFCLIFAKESLIVGWLALKVASKWDVWSNMIKMPAEFENATKLDSYKIRLAWGIRTLDRFLLGTVMSLISAFFGFLTFTILTGTILLAC